MKAARAVRFGRSFVISYLSIHPLLSTEGEVACSVFRRAAATVETQLARAAPRVGRNAATAGLFTLSLNICYLHKGPALCPVVVWKRNLRRVRRDFSRRYSRHRDSYKDAAEIDRCEI